LHTSPHDSYYMLCLTGIVLLHCYSHVMYFDRCLQLHCSCSFSLYATLATTEHGASVQFVTHCVRWQLHLCESSKPHLTALALFAAYASCAILTLPLPCWHYSLCIVLCVVLIVIRNNRLGRRHPQALVYPLSVALLSPKEDRRVAAEALMATLQQHNATLVAEVCTLLLLLVLLPLLVSTPLVVVLSLLLLWLVAFYYCYYYYLLCYWNS
jgi:hypothetical protein